jgi:ribosomal protein S27E
MDAPDSIPCEICGSDSPVVMVEGHALGQETVLPKSTMQGNSLYVCIKCPNCGEHEQSVSSGPRDWSCKELQISEPERHC